MATPKEWRDDMAKMSDEKLAAVGDALDTLRDWPLFATEYDGLRLLATMINLEDATREVEHTKDADCTLDDTDSCIVCGVHHGDPCPVCGGRGFHNEGCERAD